jgi:GNAT superfamily N-acetyltransferase
MPDHQIRTAREFDWEQFYPFLHHDKPIDSLKNAFQRFQKKLESESTGVFVAELEGQIVGVALAHEWHEYLMSERKQIRFSTLEVSLEHRKKGIGKALFEFARDWAHGIGGTWFEWYSSPSAVAFYEHMGFRGNDNPDPECPYFEINFQR